MFLFQELGRQIGFLPEEDACFGSDFHKLGAHDALSLTRIKCSHIQLSSSLGLLVGEGVPEPRKS